MVMPPWQENQYRVVVEFKKSNQGASRRIALTHGETMLPPQLQGRVQPQTWQQFMGEIQRLAAKHPYTQAPTAAQCCWNIQGLCCFICIGFGMFEPDGGSYPIWTREVVNCLSNYQPAFGQGGCRLSLQQVHGSYYIQIDVDPNVAVGTAVSGVPYPMTDQPSPYDTSKPNPAYAAHAAQQPQSQQPPAHGNQYAPTNGAPAGYPQGQAGGAPAAAGGYQPGQSGAPDLMPQQGNNASAPGAGFYPPLDK